MNHDFKNIKNAVSFFFVHSYYHPNYDWVDKIFLLTSNDCLILWSSSHKKRIAPSDGSIAPEAIVTSDGMHNNNHTNTPYFAVN